MGDKGKFTPKTPSKSAKYRYLYVRPEPGIQIEPVIRAEASAGGSTRATGVLGTSNIPGTSRTSGTGNPNSASVVCQRSSTGHKVPRRLSQYKDGERAPTQRRYSCDKYPQVVPTIDLSTVEALTRFGTIITRVSNASTAGRSAGSAGPSTPQVQPSSPKHKIENRPLGASAVPGTSGTSGAGLPSRASAVGSQWLNGEKSPPSSQSLRGRKTNGRRIPTRELNSSAVSSALPVVSLLGGTSVTPGTGVPNNASAVVPQSSKSQKRPTSKKSIQRKKNDGKNTPTQRRNASAKRGRGVSQSKNSYYTQAVSMTMSRMIEAGLPIETICNIFRLTGKNGPLGTSIIPPIPATSSAGVPSAVGPQGLNGQKSPPSDQSIPVQKKVKGKTPTAKLNSSVHQSMPSTISEHIPTNVFHENSGRQASTGSAGPSTPQVQPSTSTKSIPNGHLGIDMSRMIKAGFPIKPICNIFRSTGKNGPLGTSAVPGTPGTSDTGVPTVPSRASAVGPQRSNGQKNPPSIQSFPVQKKDVGKTPTGGSMPSTISEHIPRNWTISAVRENSGRQAPPAGRSTGSAGPSTPQVQPSTSTKPIGNGRLGTDAVPGTPGTSGTGVPSAGGPQWLNGLKSPPSNQSLQGLQTNGRRIPTRELNSSAVSSALPVKRSMLKSTGEHIVVPGTSGTSGTCVPSSESAVGPQSSNSLSNPASIQGLQGQKISGRRFPTQEPTSSAVSSALPVNCMSKSTDEHIVTNGQLKGIQRLSSKLNGNSKIESNGVVEILEVENVTEQKKKKEKEAINKNNTTTIEQIDLEEVNDDNNYLIDEIFSIVKQINEQNNNVGQNNLHTNTLIENSNIFFDMLKDIVKVILKLQNDMLKELLRNNVDVFEKVDSLTTRFESVFNTNINADESSKLNNTEELPANIDCSINNQEVITDEHDRESDDDVVMIDFDLDDEMEATKEPEKNN